MLFRSGTLLNLTGYDDPRRANSPAGRAYEVVLRPDIERQHNQLERLIEIEVKAPAPQAKLHFGDTGLEFIVRYPTEIRTAPDIDQQVTDAVLEIIEKEPNLKAAVTGLPRIRASIKI